MQCKMLIGDMSWKDFENKLKTINYNIECIVLLIWKSREIWMIMMMSILIITIISNVDTMIYIDIKI